VLGPCESGEHLGSHGSRGEAKLAELRRGACEVLDGFIADIGKLVAVLSRSRGDGVADPKDANLGELGHELDGFASEGGAANQAEGLEVRRELGELIYVRVLKRWDG
jgi:hypothetical protein